MAVLKIMDKAYADIDAEKDVYNYIMNTDKTDGCVGGYNVFADHYLDIAPTVRRLFSNNDSYRFIHFMVNNVRFTDGYVIKDYSKLRNQLTDYCNGCILEKLL